MPTSSPVHIVIVGGGAGGLELAVKLERKLGKKKLAHITLVDQNPIHVWKPLLHEVAAGTLFSFEEHINYLALAQAHHFNFRLGRLSELNRTHKTITLAPVYSNEGELLIPATIISYDILVLALGSLSNDFGTPGVSEYCHLLEDHYQAERFQKEFLNGLLKAQTQPQYRPIRIAIIGAGATGVELAAELYKSLGQAIAYGFDNLDVKKDIDITLIESAPRILAALSVKLSEAVTEELKKLSVHVLTGQKVTAVTEEAVILADGKSIPATLKVWAAGIKAASLLKNLAGLATNEKNQLLVTDSLQTTLDDSIFAFGDCAAMPKPVPPRAQVAHQQASFLVKAIMNKLKNQLLPIYHYKNKGTLVSLGNENTVGNLMGNLIGNSFYIEGKFARFTYWLLYKSHQAAVQGLTKTILLTFGQLLTRRVKPRLKLH